MDKARSRNYYWTTQRPKKEEPATLSLSIRKQLYSKFLGNTALIAEKLSTNPTRPLEMLVGEIGELPFFSLPKGRTT